MTVAAMRALLGMFLRTIATRGRLVGTAVGGLLLVLLGVALVVSDAPDGTALDLIRDAGIRLLVPVVALAFATSVLGDPAQDGSLGFIQLAPRPRWQLVVPAVLASWIVAIPLAVVPLVIIAIVNSVETSTVLAIAVAAAGGVAAYAALFTAVGLLVRRAMLYGLLYVVVWEGILAGLADGLSRVSIRVAIESLLAGLSGDRVPQFGLTGGVAAVTLVVVCAAGVGLTTLILRRHVART